METKPYSNAGGPRESRPWSAGSTACRQKMVMAALVLWDSIFPNQEKRDLEVISAAYQKILEPLSVEQLEWACTKALERCRWFPLPAELVELAAEPAVQSLELEGERAWQELLWDFDKWGGYRDAEGQPLKGVQAIPTKPPRQDCELCTGMGWCPAEGTNRVKRCPCTEPRQERAPELPAATLHALRTLGGYCAVAEEINNARASYLHKQFLEAYLYHRKTSGLHHLPAAKSDAALLSEIEGKAGIRVLERRRYGGTKKYGPSGNHRKGKSNDTG